MDALQTSAPLVNLGDSHGDENLDTLLVRVDDKEDNKFFFTIRGPKVSVTVGDKTTHSYAEPSRHSMYGAWISKLTDHKQIIRYDRNGYLCSINDINAAEIAEAWGGRIDFGDEESRLTFFQSLASHKMRERISEIHAAWAEDEAVPDGPCVMSSNPELALEPYQQVAVKASRLCRGYNLWMEQGTGKTPVVVSRVNTDAKELRDGGEKRMYRAIVVCPKSLRKNWENEFTRFSGVKGKVTVLRGGPAERVRVLAQALTPEDGELFTVVVVSYGLMVQAWETVLSRVPWDIAIVDEEQNIKSVKAERTQVALKLRDSSVRRMGLTGTPVVNSVFDLYALWEFLEKGLSGYGTFEQFKNKFGDWEKSYDGTRDVLAAVKHMPILKKRITQTSFIVRKDQVLKWLPEKQYDIIEVELSKRQQEDYSQLSDKLYLEIEEDLDSAEEEGKSIALIIENAFVKLMKLAQITSGFLNLSPERDEHGTVISKAEMIVYPENPKLDELVEQLVEFRRTHPLEKFIVWAVFKQDIRVISEALRKAGLDVVEFHGGTKEDEREISLARFNGDPDCAGMVANPEAGGAGLNLVGYIPGVNEELGTNCTWLIYYSQSHKPVQRWQSEDRAHRRTTRVPVRYTDLVVPATIDEDIRIRVMEKKKTALDVQDLRSVLKAIKDRSAR